MKKYKKLIGLFSLGMASGCLMPKIKTPEMMMGKFQSPPDLDLTLIQKENPRRYWDSFDHVSFHFSTNKSQDVHAILSRHIDEDLNKKLKEIPLGITMKESEWSQLLLKKQTYPDGKVLYLGNWQRFY